MKKLFSSLIGNEFIKNTLASDIRRGKFRHAYIIDGDPGTGRHTIANLAAKSILCMSRNTDEGELPCGKCANCRKIDSGNCTDFITVNRGDKASIGVEVIRNLCRDIYVSANECEYKVYIIDDADTMNVQAQNAFLLSLEEPPPYVVYLMITQNSGALLETIRSRSIVLRTEKLQNDLIENYLVQNNKNAAKLMKSDPDKFKSVIMCADGSIGKALSLIDSRISEPVLRRRQTALNLAKSMLASDSLALYDFMPSLPKKREDISLILEDLFIIIRDLLVLKKYDNAPLCFFGNTEEPEQILSNATSQHIMRIYDAVDEFYKDIERNANINSSFLNMVKNVSAK